MLIWGRGALIRTWALIKGNTVIPTVQIFFEAEIDLDMIVIGTKANLSLQSP